MPGRLILALILALSCAPGGLRADPTSDVCHDAARIAADRTGAPFPVLMAISLVETGRGTGSDRRAWPWAVNLEGRGHWFDTREAAQRFALDARAAGRDSFDVGCFQVNYRWHGDAFASVEHMFDPVANATYAARFLTSLHDELGSWGAAAGAYHSRTAPLAAAYRGRFENMLALLTTDPPAPAPAPVVRRPNRFPLLVASATFASAGSLMPATGDATPLFAADRAGALFER